MVPKKTTILQNEMIAPLLFLLGTAALLAASTNIAKLSSNMGFHPVTLLVWSIVGATIVLTALSAIQRQLPRLTPHLAEYFIVSAIIGVAAPNLILFAAVPKVGVSFVSLSLAFPPLFTYIGAVALKMETVSLIRSLGVALALAGAVFLATLQLSAPDAPVSWIVATLFVPVILAAGNIYRSRRWPKGVKPSALVPGTLMVSSLSLLLAGAFTELPLHVPATLTPWLLICVQTAILAVQYLLFFQLQKRGGPVASLSQFTGVCSRSHGRPRSYPAVKRAAAGWNIYRRYFHCTWYLPGYPRRCAATPFKNVGRSIAAH